MKDKRTKIVCTIGPASEGEKEMQRMMKSGMNVARLNFSHGTYDHHRFLVKNIRSVASNLGRPVAIMQDLQGPRIRIGEVHRSGLEITKGEDVVLVPEELINYKLLVTGQNKIIPIQYRELYKFLEEGKRILINDGLIVLRVKEIKKEFIYCKVERPGVIFSHRGINLPGIVISTEVITKKDKEDLQFGLGQKVDYIALSFVRDGKDVKALRKLIAQHKATYRPLIIAKIERKEAVKNFQNILDEADGIMVARGDLGIELPPEDVPIHQKEFIVKCMQSAKPVIVATQMLESMMINSRPTRAEVSDIANAVIDHTDAVMLSGETATGNYPVEAVKMMNRVIRKTERSPYDDLESGIRNPEPRNKSEGAEKAHLSGTVASQVAELAEESEAKAILTVTRTGHVARLVSSYRPELPILALTDDKLTFKQLALNWGVMPALTDKLDKDLNKVIKQLTKLVVTTEIAKKGDPVVVAIADPLTEAEEINLIEVKEV